MAGRIAPDPLTLAAPWKTFLGQSIHIDIAAIYATAGRGAQGESVLADVLRDLERLDRDRVAWHSIGLLQARVPALRGQTAAAMTQLERAVARGCWRA